MQINLTPEVERALEMCGRDRVMHNDGQPPMVAIRCAYKHAEETRWITAEGVNHNEAGALVVRKFAAELRAQGEKLVAYAQSIEAVLVTIPCDEEDK